MPGRLGFFRRRAAEVISGGAGFIASVIGAGVSFVNRFVLVATEVRPAVTIGADRFTAQGTTQAPAVAATPLGAEGAARADQAPAVDLDASLRAWSGTEQRPSLAVEQREAIDWTGEAQRPAFDVDLVGASGDAAREQHAPAVALSARISEWHRDAMPSFEMVRVAYDLNRRVGGNAQAAVGTAWTNPANAISGTNGIHDGSSATSAGGALAATRGIELAYANATGKAEFAISSAVLHVYAAVAGDATGLLTTTTISIDGGATVLEVISGNFANLAVPRSYALPALDTWAEYDALVARVVVDHAAAAVGVTASLDAIEIEIVAARVDAL